MNFLQTMKTQGNKNCSIFLIFGWLDENGFRKIIKEIKVKETDKLFIAENKDRINKDKLFKIDTMFLESHRKLGYFTYCRDGEQQKALDMIKEHITEKVKLYKSEIDALLAFVS